MSKRYHRWPTRIGSTLIDNTVPIAAGQLVEAVAKSSGSEAAVHALGLFLFLAACVPLLGFIHLRFWNRLASNILRQIVYDGFAAVQRFSADWHANAFAGATVRKITRGMWAFDSFGDTLMFGLFPTQAGTQCGPRQSHRSDVEHTGLPALAGMTSNTATSYKTYRAKSSLFDNSFNRLSTYVASISTFSAPPLPALKEISSSNFSITV